MASVLTEINQGVFFLKNKLMTLVRNITPLKTLSAKAKKLKARQGYWTNLNKGMLSQNQALTDKEAIMLITAKMRKK